MQVKWKYAPQNLSEVIYPDATVQRRIDAYAHGQLQGHVLMHGPNGTGKSTVANLLPKAIDGSDAIVEDKDFDALLERADLKDYLRNACAANRFSGSTKFFLVFHELDNVKCRLDKLWTVMDDLQDELMVIVTTNNPMKVHASLRSRCKLIEFPALTARQVLSRAQFILKAEGVTLPDAQVLHYLQAWDHVGDLRKYFDVLDELIFLQQSGMPFPVVQQAGAPALKVVQKSK